MRIGIRTYLKTAALTLLIPYLFGCKGPSREVVVVLLPDTQTYAEKFPHILQSQIDWIIDNSEKIDFVLQQGDLTQNNSQEEWEVVADAFSRLNGSVPYVLAVGNHDMGSAPGKFADTRNTSLFNNYFPFETMKSLPGFEGAFETGKLDNAFYLFEAGRHKWMVLSLEFGPRDEVLEWAGQVAERYPDRTVIVNTHSYMYSDDTRQGDGDHWRPQAYGVGKVDGSVNDGEQIWMKLISQHENIRFVFSGHVLNSGHGRLISINQAGYPVYQFLANYQQGVKGSQNGGNGFLRILKLDLKENILTVSTYSPFLDEYNQFPAHDFVVRDVILTSH